MSPLVETIKITNGEIHNLNHHNDRLNRSNSDVYGATVRININEHIVIPTELLDKTLKCRVIYATDIKRIEISEYHLKPIRSLQVVHHDTICYQYKSTNRTELNKLYELRRNADDILIVRNGLITDTWYANVALHRDGMWYTPNTPLLAGTKRAQLISEGKLKPLTIRISDLDQYDHLSIINAMIDLEELTMPISKVQR